MNPLVVRCVIALAAVVLVVATALALLDVSPGSRGAGPGRSATAGAPVAGQAVCGRAVLQSPWDYHGPAGQFRDSKKHAGLPTFGAAGTDFPAATSVLVVAPGDNTNAASSGRYPVNHTVVYFEPGLHRIQAVMYTGHDSAYVGGYTPDKGEAVLDGVDGATGGTGKGGSFLSYSKPSSGNNVHNTWEYLTIRNYAASQNNAVMGNVNGGGSDNGDIYRFNTIGPNLFGYRGEGQAPGTGQSSGGGYAINAGSDTVIEYNCLTRNA
jgi:hypothetical protein